MKKQQRVFEGRIVRLTLDTVMLPNDAEAELEIVHHPGGAAVVAIDEQEQVCLLKQYRYAVGQWVWELPAGKLDPGEPPLATAQRELMEEVGAQARAWHPLGSMISSPGVFTERVYLYLAKGLQLYAPNTEAHEVFEVHWLPFAEALARAACGEIEDAKTVIGLFRASHLTETDSGVRRSDENF